MEVDEGDADGWVDAGVDGGGEAGGEPVGSGVDVVFVDPDVGHVGGVLVKDACGWPGPLCRVDGGAAPIDEGGRLWWWPASSWDVWVGRVLDMCDDHEAFVVIRRGAGHRRGIDYSAEIPPYEMERIVEARERHPIVCSDAEAAVPHWKCWSGLSELRAYLDGFEEPPASSEVMAWVESEGLGCIDAAAERRRYVYVTRNGPMLPEASVEAAVGAYRRLVERVSYIPGEPLGTLGEPYYWVEPPRDEVVVRESSWSVIDGVVRGLAHNQSERLWARNVAITAIDPAGVEAVGRLGLVVQPGEVMPFEIEGWTGSQSPSEISFEVSADLSPTIDLSRSLLFDRRLWQVTKEIYLQEFPEEMLAGAIPDDGYFDFLEVVIRRAAPKSHQRLGEAALEHKIENLVVYKATFDGPAVIEVFELTPMARGLLGPPFEWIEVAGIPAELPDGGLLSEITVELIPSNSAPWIWAGEAA